MYENRNLNISIAKLFLNQQFPRVWMLLLQLSRPSVPFKICCLVPNWIQVLIAFNFLGEIAIRPVCYFKCIHLYNINVPYWRTKKKRKLYRYSGLKPAIQEPKFFQVKSGSDSKLKYLDLCPNSVYKIVIRVRDRNGWTRIQTQILPS